MIALALLWMVIIGQPRQTGATRAAAQRRAQSDDLPVGSLTYARDSSTPRSCAREPGGCERAHPRRGRNAL